MEDTPPKRDPRLVILDGVRTEQRRQVATDRLQPRLEGRTDPSGPPDRAALVREIEALEVIAGICEVQTRAARAAGTSGALDRWHRLTGLVEAELAALRAQRDRRPDADR